MVGLGVGVDYALLLVARLRDEAGREARPTMTAPGPDHQPDRRWVDSGCRASRSSSRWRDSLAGILAISAMAYACALTVATGVPPH